MNCGSRCYFLTPSREFCLSEFRMDSTTAEIVQEIGNDLLRESAAIVVETFFLGVSFSRSMFMDLL